MVNRFKTVVRSYIPAREEGQGLVEYGLILAGVSIACIVALFLLGPLISKLFNTVGSSLGG